MNNANDPEARRPQLALAQKRAASAFAVLVSFALTLSLRGAAFHPPAPTGTREIEDERGVSALAPQQFAKQAVFMAVGIGEYLLVTGQPRAIVTSAIPENLRIRDSRQLREAFPGVEALHMPMSAAEAGAVNLETLLLEKPDVVVTWGRLAEPFERIGLRTIGLGPANALARHVQNTRLFADIAGRVPRGLGMIARYENRRVALRAEAARFGGAKTRVAIVNVADDGLFRPGFAFADLIADAGGVDLTAGLTGGPLNTEEMLRLAPDVIVITGGGGRHHDAPRRLMADPAFATLPAARNRRVYLSPPGVSGYMGDLMETPIYLRWLIEAFHPGALRESVADYARAVYREELGAAPDDEELDAALALSDNPPAQERRP